ncbi:MAG TPA: formate/nitrite transporter family protein [candidate division WOR-3 bacterium]|uniref:Formate/nitrite transporter family protein n=1 Tax=candidate division WOR-3 bacterium TaxID=2052148 RepID=A0A7V0LU75_UNCW3|nr:MAG: formate/nitrite transporter family protein [Candidatus Hydrothermae bacterium]HDL60021.1 formate/nitrite transporter family protein [candidate division WOR-3 bacterium]
MQFECRTPAAIADTLTTDICVKKTHFIFYKLFILGILAGVYIGFGAELATMVGHDVAKYMGVGMAKLIMGAVFSVGLMLVVIAGAELFTGNNLIFLSVLDKRAPVWRLFYNWIVVYIANLIGSLLLVILMYWSGLWKTNGYLVGATALKIANAKVNLSFLEAFARGVGCNWLVCLAVWIAFSARQTIGKIFAIFFPIMAFVASGFEHSVANMYFIPMGMFLKNIPHVVAAAGYPDLSNLNMYGFWVRNELPVTLGNMVGGAFFVAMLYWIVYIWRERKIA